MMASAAEGARSSAAEQKVSGELQVLPKALVLVEATLGEEAEAEADTMDGAEEPLTCRTLGRGLTKHTGGVGRGVGGSASAAACEEAPPSSAAACL